MTSRTSRYAVAFILGSAAVTACGGEELFEPRLASSERLLDTTAVAQLASDDQQIDQMTVVGDLDGDGIDDAIVRTSYVVRDPDHVFPEQSNVYILYGGPQVTGRIDLTGLPSLTGGNGANEGSSLAAVGDVDGDGLADVLITASRNAACAGDPTGTGDELRTGAYLVYGSRTRLTGATPLASVAAFLRDSIPCSFVTTVAALGDLDGDGKADFAVARGGTSGDAEAFVFYGSAVRVTGMVDLRATADAVIAQAITDPRELSEPELVGVGDVDGDGYGDFMFRDPIPFTTEIRLVRGSATRLAGTVAPAAISQTVFHDNAQCSSGQDLAFPLGDLDGDGADDFALPSCQLDAPGPGPLAATRVQRIFYGRTAGFPAQLAGEDADAAIQATGASPRLLAGGDVDGDGIRDLLVGDAALHNGNGAVHVIKGDRARLAGSVDPATRATTYVGGTQRGTQCGYILAPDCIVHALAGWDLGVGDLSGDHRADLLIEAPSDQDVQSEIGVHGSSLARIYLLSLGGTNP